MSSTKKSRELYIDILKGLAMTAVIVDHVNFYGGIFSQYASYSIFSVSLFVLVIGYNLFSSYEKRPLVNIVTTWGRMSKFLLFYAIATAGILIIGIHKFSLIDYLKMLINFSGSGAFYFCLIYIQLIMISGVVFKLFKLSRNIIVDIIIVLLSLGLSYLFEKYTFMLPVHGGGEMLLGATYFFLFVLGNFFSKRIGGAEECKIVKYLCV